MNVMIYQVKRDIDEDNNILFWSFERIKKKIPNIKQQFRDYYDKVYEFTLNTKYKTDAQVLNDVYNMFNQDHPEDFRGHSLSVSDIVILEDKMYLCDSFRWIEL